MAYWMEFTRSIEHLLLIWGGCVCLVIWFTWKGGRVVRQRSLFCMHKNEEGAAYSLSFLMVFPFYVLLIAIIFETTFVFLAKMGTMHSSYAAARAAAVYTTVNFQKERQGQPIPPIAMSFAKKAAVQSMTPYARGIFQDDQFLDKDLPAAQTYLKAFHEYLSMNNKTCRLNDSYLKKKYAYAYYAVSVSAILAPGSGSNMWDKELEVTLTYKSPAFLPYIGKLLGAKKSTTGDQLYYYELITKSSIANECPKNETGHLGIRYLK